jgi:hypothetical protein
LIAEEGPTNSVAAQVAASHGLPLILPIDMDDEQRKAAGIYEALCKRPTTVVDENGKDILDEYGDPKPRNVYLRHADGIREEFWLDRVEEAQPKGPVLLICGYKHLDFLADKIELRGHCASKKVFPPRLVETTFEILD